MRTSNYTFFISKKSKSENHTERLFKSSVDVSTKEVFTETKKFIKSPNHAQLLSLIKVVTNDSAWVGQAFLRLLSNKIKVKTPFEDQSSLDQQILKQIALNLPQPHVSYPDIFKAIFSDVERSHHDPSYKSQLACPPIKSTIVLISGVLNEIFSTAAFERGALHLSEKYGLNYITPQVDGLKGTAYNANQLYKQLNEHIQKNPDEKLWLIAFSKGGVDTLHFLHKYKEFAAKHVVGLSTIASPILGSKNSDHKLVNLLESLAQQENLKIKSKEALRLKRSLSEKRQKEWFTKNYNELPQNLFYTSVAFEAEWYESHLWMMLAKMLFQSNSINDGIVEAENALFPNFFQGINLGILKGHHLIGTRSSYYSQEALLESHIIFLNYLKLLS